MKVILAALLLACSFGGSGVSAREISSSHYTMFGAHTELMDFDVDYYAPPVQLHRVKNTFQVHDVTFDVARYVQECYYWQKVCTAYNHQGQCIRWENQCSQWGWRAYRVEKRIQIDLRTLPALADKEDETYELRINRHKPGGQGEDWVTTDLHPVSTKIPVIVKKWGDFRYVIEPIK